MILETFIGEVLDEEKHDEHEILVDNHDEGELKLEDEVDDITLQDVNSVELKQKIHIIDLVDDDDGDDEMLDMHIADLHEDEVHDIYEELLIE